MKTLFQFKWLTLLFLITGFMAQGQDQFNKQWKTIDSLENKGLYRAALEKVNDLYQTAITSNNTNQSVKALMYQLKFNQHITEDDYVLGIHHLESMIPSTPSPTKLILHSILAEVYFGYYSHHSWQFADRTSIGGEEKPEDLRTWDLKRLAEKVIHHHLAALENSDETNRMSLKSFEDIVYIPFNEDIDHYTLYDLLAERAINFFSQNSFNIEGPAETFTISDPGYFKTDKTFLNLNLISPDSLNLKFYAATTFQALTAATMKKNNAEASFQLKLKRFKFAKQFSTLANADALYINAIKQLTIDYKDYAFVGEAWYELAKELVNSGREYISTSTEDNKRWQLKQAALICEEVIAKYPKTFGARQCQALRSQIRQKNLNITAENVYLPQTKGTFLINYQNIDSVFYKIVPVQRSKKMNSNELKAYLQKAKGVYEHQLVLKNPGDYHLHKTEALVPELDHGEYYLVSSSGSDYDPKNNGIAFCRFWVTQLIYQTKTLAQHMEIIAMCRKTGHPLEKAEVKVTYRTYNRTLGRNVEKTLGNYTTDKEGRVKIKELSQYQSYQISIKSGDDYYEPEQNVYYHQRNYETYKQTIVNLYTDRKIYRPGQVIYFKGIVMSHHQGDNTLMSDHSTTVDFLDVNGQKIKSLEVSTNAFGSFSGQFTAPYGVLTGAMTIRTPHGSTSVQVEEYKRPKFSGTIDPIKGEYALNDSIPVHGSAMAFAGHAIDGAKVTYSVQRTTQYNFRYWWYPSPQPKMVMTGETVTDDKGQFDFTFKAIPDESQNPEHRPIFRYIITVDIIDINGETHSASQSFSLGYQSLILSNTLKESLNRQDGLIFNIMASGLNGDTLTANGTFEIQKLKSPDLPLQKRLWDVPDQPQWDKSTFENLFPGKTYQHENDFTSWPVEKTVAKQDFNTKTSGKVSISNLKKWPVGQYKYVSRTKDKNGVDVEDIKFFTLFDPEDKTAPTNDIFYAQVLNPSAQPGESVDILVSTAEAHLNVWYDVEHKGKTEKEDWLHLKNEQILISLPVTEAHIGGFRIDFTVVKNNRTYNVSKHISVPEPDRDLKVVFETFRNKLLPGENETWTLIIKNAKDQKAEAELLATLYDASLDDLFQPNAFNLRLSQAWYPSYRWAQPVGTGITNGRNLNYQWNNYSSISDRSYPYLQNFGYYASSWGQFYRQKVFSPMAASRAGEVLEDNMEIAMDEEMDVSANGKAEDGLYKNKEGLDSNMPPGESDNTEEKTPSPQPRKNFNETAFFHPQLHTDANGEIRISFTMPESLTKWRFIGLAHSKLLEIGQIEKELVTQKELMVIPNMPRFLREGDEIQISTKISNISDQNISGQIALSLFDPATETEITSAFDVRDLQQNFSVDATGSILVSWSIKVPDTYSAVKYRIMATSPNHHDGEENILPVLSNRMLVTESLPMPMSGKGDKTFRFTKLLNQSSETLKHHRLALEFTSNPAWYALQAMPYMMEYPYECAEQTFTRYYSNAIASHVLNSKPRIKKIIGEWQNDSPDAFLSNLNKNQELKSLLLEETPWVLNAKSEAETKRNLAILLDLDRMQKELDRALNKTIKNQSVYGGWSWFPGMRPNRYMTQHIITGLGHLNELGIADIKENPKVWRMVKQGLKYLDREIVKDFNLIKKQHADYRKENHLGYLQIQYLYVRSYFMSVSADKATKEAIDYFSEQARTYWLSYNIYAKGMIGLAANRMALKDLASDIHKSLKDNAIIHEEFGMYWKANRLGYYWYQAPVETQALMIEFFNEMSDLESVELLKIHLLKEKQTTHWKTTKQTAEAVYALLLNGIDLLANEELAKISIGGKALEYVNTNPKNSYQVKPEAGTGYIKTEWSGEDIQADMGTITIKKTSSGVAWGSVYWQYFEDLDKITFHETPLQLQKQLYKVVKNKQGESMTRVSADTPINIGDKIRVRIELRTDRNLEYVHLKDMRAAGFEPINVISSYHYQDGLGYYQATKDAATNFFFDYIPKGTYVFEYDLSAQQKGEFSNGLANIQCMYAPEFMAHSDGIRISIK